MYQLIGLRPTSKAQNNKGISDKYYNILPLNYQDLVAKTQHHVDKLQQKYGEGEDYNIYFTAQHATPNNRKGFIKQDLVSFDIDHVDYNRTIEYMIAFTIATELDWEMCWVVQTGHGLQLHYHTNDFNKEFIATHKSAYSAVCEKLSAVLKEYKLPGIVDTSVWSATQLLRYPGTWNRKPIATPNFESSTSFPAVTYNIPQSFEPQNFPWQEWVDKVGLDLVPGAARDEQGLELYAAPNPEYIIENCLFLKHQMSLQGKGMSYKEWFHALGVLAHLRDLEGNYVDIHAHRISAKYADYDRDETQEQIENCRKADGPIKCSSISLISNICKSCRHFQTKLGSPAALREISEQRDGETLYRQRYGEPDLLEWHKRITGEEIQEIKEVAPPEIRGDIHHSVVTPLEEKTTKLPDDHDRINPIEKSTEVATINSNEKEEAYWNHLINTGFSVLVGQDDKPLKTPKRLVNELKEYLDFKYHFVNIPEIGRTYVWSDNFYKTVTRDHLRGFAGDLYFPKVTRELDRNEFCNSVTASNLKDKSFLSCEGTEGFINLKNGILRCSDMQIIPHSPKFNFFHKLPYSWTQDLAAEGCPTWEQLLDNLTCGRQHLKDILEEFAGWCLLGGRYRPQRILVIFGDGDNGKTTFLTCMKMLMGKENCSSIPATGVDTPHLAVQLENMLMNTSEEEPPESFRKTGPLKRMSGDGEITVSRLFENKYGYINRAKEIITCNVKPHLTDTSGGMRRRLLILPFEMSMTKTPEKRIPNLEPTIEKELPAILERCVAAGKRMLERGDFITPPESDAEYNEMITQSDDVLEWLEENVEVTGNEEDYVISRVLWNLFNEDNKRNRETSTRFLRKVSDKLVERGALKSNHIKDGVSKEKRGYKKVKYVGDLDLI